MPHVDGVDDSVGYGVRGRSYSGQGVYGYSDNYIGVSGSYSGIDVFGGSSQSEGGYAAVLDARVYVTGPLYKPGLF
jgi:hypothetical protein